jgi:ribosomal-protein-alanine N-acetyltransferase
LQNKLARYIVVAEPPESDGPAPARPGPIRSAIRRIVGPPVGTQDHLLGFIGVWMMAGEAHIVTVAVREARRRMGLGERLLIACIELAMDSGQEVVTLEVRKSNDGAQRLYEKYGFQRVGLRVRYYTDNNEDAVLMTTPDLATPSYVELFDRLRADHRARHPDLWD